MGQLDYFAPAEIKFLRKVAAELNTPEAIDRAFRVTQAVFNVLRDTINVEDSKALITKFPSGIKDMYSTDWDVLKERSKLENSNEFYKAVSSHTDPAIVDIDDTTDARQGTQAVFKVMKEYAPEYIMQIVKNNLPPSLQSDFYQLI